VQNKLFILALALSLFGAFVQFLFGWPNALNHLLFIFFAVLAYIALVKLDSFFLLKLSPVVCLIGIVILLGLFLVDPVRGAHRWYSLWGFSFQPAVFFAPFFLLFLSNFLSSHSLKKTTSLLLLLVVLAIPLFLIFKQPDLGTTLVVGFSLFAVILFTKIKIRQLVFFLVILGLVGLALTQVLQAYQWERLTSFLNPSFDPSGVNYNSLQSSIAIGSGGTTGKGFVDISQSRLNFLPEAKTDFAFAALTEAFGFIGSLVMLSMFLIFFKLLLDEVFQAKPADLLQLFTVGTVTFIFIQFIFTPSLPV